MSQEALARACGFSNTALSTYETGKKVPSLSTLAKIAKRLNVSVERLYYGDENKSFIISETDEGKKIVNAIYFLWKTSVITYASDLSSGINYQEYFDVGEPRGVYLCMNKYSTAIKRLLSSLEEFKKQEETYSDKEKYLEMLLSSVATEIDIEIEREKVYYEKHMNKKI